MTAKASETLEYRVKLRSSAGELVTFNVTPDLSETRSVNYKTVDPIHAPGQIYAYVNSTSRTYQLSGVKLVSRTRAEAETNLNYLWLLRSWTLPAFGRDPLSTTQRDNRRERLQDLERFAPESDQFAAGERRRLDNEGYGVDLHGAPPQVLRLTAYSHDGHIGRKAHINRVPVVITTLNIPYPSDVDYFPTRNGVPMPSVMIIDITLNETHSPTEYENFRLTDFKRGILRGF